MNFTAIYYAYSKLSDSATILTQADIKKKVAEVHDQNLA